MKLFEVLSKFWRSYGDALSSEEVHRVIVVTGSAVAGVPILVMLSIASMVQQRLKLGIFLLVAAVVVSILACGMRRGFSISRTAHLFTASLSLLFFTLALSGGVNTTGYLWAFPFPLVISMLYRTRTALIISLLFILGIVSCMLLSQLIPGGAVYPWTLGVRTGLVLLLMTALLAVHGTARGALLARNGSLDQNLQQLQQAQEKLVEAEKMATIGRLAAGIAHEVNNPVGFVASNMTTLKSYVTRLKEVLTLYDKNAEEKVIERHKKHVKYTTISEDIDALIMENLEGLARITNIVNDLKKFVRKDTDTGPGIADINEGLRSVLLLSKNEWKYTVDVHTEYGTVDPVPGRINELNQVFLNMIVNAVQAWRELGRQERGNLTIQTWSEEQWVLCSIRDNGPGIPPEVRDSIFEPFFTTKEAGVGTGLGLSIAWDIIVNRHKGTIAVESEIGKGTCFTIKLPRRTDSAESEKI
jgi:signal transduction histidine kinase